MDWKRCLLLFLALPSILWAQRQRLGGNHIRGQRPTLAPVSTTPTPGIVGFIGGPDPDPMRKLMYHAYKRFLSIRLYKQGDP